MSMSVVCKKNGCNDIARVHGMCLTCYRSWKRSQKEMRDFIDEERKYTARYRQKRMRYAHER